MRSAVPVLRHGGFVVVIVGVFLPWLRVAPSNRSGFESAELLVSLAEIGAPDALRSLGIIWYVGAFAALLGWGATTLAGDAAWLQSAGFIGPVAGAAAWATFGIVAGVHNSVNGQAPGPVAATAGCVLLVASGIAERWAARPANAEKASENRT